MLTTLHDMTNTQTLIDAPHKDLRRARATSLSFNPNHHWLGHGDRLDLSGAAYGGAFIALSLVWGWLVGGVRPDRPSLWGAGLVVVGAAIIVYWPRGGA